MDRKRILYIFIAVAAIILLALAAYYFFGKHPGGLAVTPPGGLPSPGALPPPGPVTTPTPPPQYGTGQAGGPKFGVVAQNHVLEYFVDPQNNVLIVQPDGEVAKVTNGNSVILSSSQVAKMVHAEFSPDGAKIIALFGSVDAPQASVFDVANKSWQPLSGDTLMPTWGPAGYQITYFKESGGVKSVMTLDLANQKAKPVELFRIHEQGLSLKWINSNQLLLLDKPSALVSEYVLSYDVKNKALSVIAGASSGLDSTWSGAASMGLVFNLNPGGAGLLSLIDASGNNIGNLSLQTLPEKCSFDTLTQNAVVPPAPKPATSTTSKSGKAASHVNTPAAPPPIILKFLYCSVPRDPQKLSIGTLPDDYYKKVIFTSDDFYKTDLSSGAVSQIFADQTQNLDANDLKIADKSLFFVNRFDGKLYGISLK